MKLHIRFRLLLLTALVEVGGGVYRHEDTIGEETTEEGCTRLV